MQNLPNIFALGDCINAPCSKNRSGNTQTDSSCSYELIEVMDKQPVTDQYDGYSACPIPTQYGKLMLAEFD